MLLQVGPPGSTELMFLGVLNILLAVVIGYLIYRDADSRGSDNAVLWGLGMGAASLLLSFIGMILAIVIYYLIAIRE
jgi:hypothetical protein